MGDDSPTAPPDQPSMPRSPSKAVLDRSFTVKELKEKWRRLSLGEITSDDLLSSEAKAEKEKEAEARAAEARAVASAGIVASTGKALDPPSSPTGVLSEEDDDETTPSAAAAPRIFKRVLKTRQSAPSLMSGPWRPVNGEADVSERRSSGEEDEDEETGGAPAPPPIIEVASCFVGGRTGAIRVPAKRVTVLPRGWTPRSEKWSKRTFIAAASTSSSSFTSSTPRGDHHHGPRERAASAVANDDSILSAKYEVKSPVFAAQYATLAFLEAAAEAEEEEDERAEREAIEKAERAAAEARQRRDAALMRIAEVKEQQKRMEAEAVAARERQKAEEKAAAARRREAMREAARERARAVGQRLAQASSVGQQTLASVGENTDEISQRAASMTRRATAVAGQRMQMIRQRSVPVLEKWHEVGHQAFGFAIGVREGFKKTLSFSVVREEDPQAAPPGTPGAVARPPMTIRCPCTACGHLNTTTIDDAQFAANSPNGGNNTLAIKITCERCEAGLTVRITKRDPRLSI